MDQKTIKNFTYVAAFCFSIMAIMNISSAIRYQNFMGWFYVIGYILVVIALVTSVPALSTVGFAIHIIPVILSLFQSDFSYLFYFCVLQGILIILYNLTSLPVHPLLMLASIKRTHAKTLCISAAVLYIVSSLINMLRNIILVGSTGYTSIFSLISLLLVVVGEVCLGIAYEGTARRS